MAGIAAITEREIELVSRFIALLNNEQEALKQGEPSALPEIGAEKTTLVEQLNALESERRAELGVADEQNTRDGMTQWLARHPKERTTAANWNKLLELAREAKALNEQNAGLVTMHLKLTANALTILTRQSGQNPLYGANGQAAPVSGSRIVDSA